MREMLQLNTATELPLSTTLLQHYNNTILLHHCTSVLPLSATLPPTHTLLTPLPHPPSHPLTQPSFSPSLSPPHPHSPSPSPHQVQKNDLVVAVAAGKRKLVELEDTILRMLSEASGSLLDDEELVRSSRSSRSRRIEV